MEKYFVFLALVLLFACASKVRKDYPIQPVSFTRVKINDNFWAPRLETNREVTIPYDFKKCEETGRIDNFAKAGGLMEGEFVGIRYNDSDVFKVIEGASYSLSIHPDKELERYLDELIEKIAAAQEDDGYLYTARTINPEKLPPRTGKTRWSYLNHSHELYNVGHMYEAAVAFYQATGKKSLLNVALKNADLIDSVFGPEGRHDPPGHQEIEIGLCKLYRVTGDERYLRLAKFFLDQRGRENGRKLYTDLFPAEYTQDHKPVVQQDEAVGHAVRAGYMYSAMADVAALTGDKNYLKAIDKIWENVVSKKLYITGGIGARSEGEAFGDNYELPNRTAYNETCAAIANIFWNHRMFLLHGDAKYIDVLERTLYNGFLSGVSLSGQEFFYPNPLESTGEYQRSPWFDCSCCPTNVVRFLPSLPGYIYAQDEENIYVNLFVQSEADIELQGSKIKLKQRTGYPWQGDVRIEIHPEIKTQFCLNVRMPGWVLNKPLPSELYRYLNFGKEKPILKLNGEELEIQIDKGFAKINREWQAGDVVELYLPMEIKKLIAHEKVAADRGRMALERGPIVFCAEGVDNQGQVLNLILDKNGEFKYEFIPQLLKGVGMLKGKATAISRNSKGEIFKEQRPFVAIPYYAWAHRGKGEMEVWFAMEEKVLKNL